MEGRALFGRKCSKEGKCSKWKEVLYLEGSAQLEGKCSKWKDVLYLEGSALIGREVL